MKITMIGGGSVQWTPILVTDVARTAELAGATFMLHDIDADALALLERASQRVVSELGADIQIAATTDRAEALDGADYVILCVAIGGLAAVRDDLAIPQRYGIAQSVGDTVGPGGLIRGLRNIPFAAQVAREMEQRCPQAWLLNLSNPMTTICRGITRATGIRTIGLCHEVGGVRHALAEILGVPYAQIELEVAGINHLPAILRFTAGGRDGMPALRAWLAEHGAFAHVDQHNPDALMDVFYDRLALKLTLFEQLGVLFGAGDRHVAEFFPGFLTEATEHGMRYGIKLTTVEQRQTLALRRRDQIERFADGESTPPPRSGEQLAAIIAALAGGTPGRFVVNVPNIGQIDNLPREATVECIAEVDGLGVRPLAVGALPHAAHAVIAPHVARQELIVEAALSGRREPALAALSSDPLLRDVADAAPMLDALLVANSLSPVGSH
jgi:alpha-galactosidase/6-phospho-beta-glucosidase family protein